MNNNAKHTSLDYMVRNTCNIYICIYETSSHICSESDGSCSSQSTRYSGAWKPPICKFYFLGTEISVCNGLCFLFLEKEDVKAIRWGSREGSLASLSSWSAREAVESKQQQRGSQQSLRRQTSLVLQAQGLPGKWGHSKGIFKLS